MKNRDARRKVSILSFSLMVLAIFALMPSAQAVYEKTYTSDADFDEGTFVGVEHDTVHDQLQLNKSPTTLPFIWVPNSPMGSVSKVNTETGDELGRYIVAPPGVSVSNGNPSRTTVDLKGNVWVGNREAGTVVKIGLYENGQCKDRNGNGIIDTSLDTNHDGNIIGAEILPWGTDECVLYEVVLVPGSEGTHTPGTYTGSYDTDYWGTAPRGLAIDRDNNLWAGTSGTKRMFYINGDTGAIEKNIDVANIGGSGAYGAVIDKNGKVWISVLGSGIRKFDPLTETITQEIALWHAYGIGLDYNNSLLVGGGGQISKININDGTIRWTKPALSNQGIVATSDNNIWVASNTAHRYFRNGSWIASVPGFSTYITGVTVDAAGKVWGTEYSDWIRRIDPATNTVDLSKQLIGSGAHYTYSDMTGIMARTVTTKIGTWTVDFDSEADSKWGALSWNNSEPIDTSIKIQARSSNNKISWSAWEMATNGVALSSTPDGRYLQIEITFQSNGNEMPILYDITPKVISQEPLSQIVAEAGGPYVVYEGVPKTINAAGSYGPPGDILSYEWNFGFGKLYGFEITQTARDGPNTRIIILNVTNGNGGFATDTATWNVINVNPIVNAGPDQTINAGDTAHFTASFSDVLPDMNKSTAQIDYGDETTENVIANPDGTISSSHVYPNSGIYTVNLTVTDKDGGVGSDTLTVTVDSTSSTIVAEAGGPYTVYEGIPVTINASGSSGPPGDILTYEWDFEINKVTGFEITRTPRDGPRIRTLVLNVSNGKGGFATDTALWNVINVNPVVNAGPDQTINVGDIANFAASFSDVQPDMNASIAQIDYGDETTENVTANPDGTILSSHVYPNSGVYTVTLSVTDKDGGIGSDTLIVTVVLPIVAEAGGPYITYEGVPTTMSANGSSGDILTYEWNFGFAKFTGFEIIRTPRDGPLERTIILNVTNGKGGFATDTAMWTVNNVNPVVNAGPDQTINEGDTVHFAASFSDVQPDMNNSTALIDYGDGTTENAIANPDGTVSGSHKYLDNGIYTVIVTVTDKDGGIGSDTLTVIVNNVNPVVDPITSPIDPQSITSTISINSSFTDVGILDNHTVTLDWDDGTTSTGTITESGGSGSVTASHVYSTPGVYTITLTVTDKDGGIGTATSSLIVIYDPNGGFVTGGGWINSPAGAYVSDPTLVGKANFGFVSKYSKGATVPTGQTEFQFKAGDLNFHSSSYDWLVIAGARAQYKGSGTINGAGDYTFMLTAIDGQVNGGGGTDKFRMKIWNKTNGSKIYDNQNGATDDAEPTTTIAGGSIAIHK